MKPTAKFLLCFLAFSTRVLFSSAQQPNDGVPHDFRNFCPNSPTLKGKRHSRVINWLLQVTGEKSLLLKSSPQNKAACWMIFKDPHKNRTHGSRAAFRQRYAMTVFFYATKGPEDWYGAVSGRRLTSSGVDRSKDVDTTGSNDWMTPTHECTWYGVTCGSNLFSRKTVMALEISFFGVGGLLPREMSLLVDLKELDLHGNDLQGVLPHLAVFHWKNLEVLRLHMNGFFGSLITEVGKMTSLTHLSIFGNYFGGTIPTELANLKKLESFDGYANNFKGTIPSELAKIPKLRELDLHDNDLVGTVPVELCKRNLSVLITDCLGPDPEVTCPCCTVCCRGLPRAKCVDVKTGEPVIP